MKTKPRHRSKTYFDPSTLAVLRQIGLGLLVVSCIGILIALVWWSTRLSVVTVAAVEVSGGLTISHDMVRARVEEKLVGTYLGIVPRRFVYWYPQVAIQTAVEEVPRIRDVQIIRDGTTLQVLFDEYVPEALWCGLQDASPCFFLDAAGFAFAPAPALHGSSLLRYYSTEASPQERQTPFLLADYVATKRFVSLLEEIGWYVSRVEVNQARDVFYTVSGGGELKATLTEAPEKLFENLRTILQSKEFSHLAPGNFQYLDLRFGTRVFVNEELPSDVGTSSAVSATTTTITETE